MASPFGKDPYLFVNCPNANSPKQNRPANDCNKNWRVYKE
jgi:hypothetical protein